ncbi:MAG TPA: TspO/MBR family protein [Thermoanaerobaculia bacterium]
MFSLVVFIAVVAAAAITGGQFMPGEWYAQLAKPSWTPPSWLFGPVWTVLYVAIAMAGWLVWRADKRVGVPLALWIAQIVLNAAWSWLFFGLHRPGTALIEIVILLALIVGFAVAAWPVNRTASILFVPYALWVGFATALNFAIWRLNPGAP